MRLLVALWLGAVALVAPSMAGAHALQPGYLELRALGGDTFRVLWRKPDVNGEPMPIDPVFGERCASPPMPPLRFDGEGYAASWTIACEGGLSGTPIRIDGLEATRTDVLVRYELTPGEGQSWRLDAGATEFIVPVAPGPMDVLRSYVVLGVEHILFGLDHLLFVLALLILIRDWRRLVLTITAFTLAHSITLGAAAVGLLNVPGPPVEAVIALSIMFVAAEILHRDPAKPRLSERLPWLVAFFFGLLHGLGFGSALRDIGLPDGEIVLALLAFNVGVEAGQLIFVAVVAGMWVLCRRIITIGTLARVQQVTAYAIGGVAAFWFMERLTGF